MLLRETSADGSLSRLQERPDPLDRCRPGLSPSPEIEYEARIADRIPAEAGRSDLTPIQELLDFTK